MVSVLSFLFIFSCFVSLFFYKNYFSKNISELINVNNNLEPFSRINPCGFQNLQMTKISDFVAVNIDEVGNKFCEKISENLTK